MSEEERTNDFERSDFGRDPLFRRTGHMFQDLLPHGSNQQLLLHRIRTHRQRRQEPPNGFIVEIDIGSHSIDRRSGLSGEVVRCAEGEGRDRSGGREERGEFGREDVEEVREDLLPLEEILRIRRRRRLFQRFGSTEEDGQEGDSRLFATRQQISERGNDGRTFDRATLMMSFRSSINPSIPVTILSGACAITPMTGEMIAFKNTSVFVSTAARC